MGLLVLLGLTVSARQPAWARRGALLSSNRSAVLRQAQPFLDKGAAALAARDFAAAAKALSSAYRSAPLPEVLLQLARLAQAEGRSTDAYDLYHRYLADPTRVPDAAGTQEAEAVLATPPPGTGSLAVHGPPSTFVLVDGRMVGVLPLPQPLLLAPGDHSLLLDLGNKRIDTPLKVQEGRLAEVRTGRSSGALLISVLPALLVLDEWAGVPAESLRQFSEAVERAAILQHLGVMPAAVALRQAAELRACLGATSCQQQLAKRSGLDYVLRSRTARETKNPATAQTAHNTQAAPAAANATASWTFELSLLHAEVGEPASQLTATCDACTAAQATVHYRDALLELLNRGLPRQFGTADVTSEPTGAVVSVSRRPAGQTPLHLPLWEGSTELTLTLSGYKPALATVAVTAATATPLHVALEAADPLPMAPKKPPPAARLRPPRWRLALGGTLVSLGATLLTVGGLDLLVDGRCFPLQPADTSPGATQCRVLYDTRDAGLAGLGVGLAFSIAGTVLLAIPGPRPAAVP